ncbi:hypothetical protein LLQ46_22765 [Rouxiella badensis]|uniref:hypothetical protein n=1 Tax=Rouxiella badensis TaxID=1646377 RepID=UPI001B592CBC|nr:hypothetical protein [Rouxiella badensis]MCC3749684.1 hypothetical protein [Rouxiella badensis]
MSATANWSYTAKCTIWRRDTSSPASEFPNSAAYLPPEVIMCDYQGGLSKKVGDVGSEKVVKNTIWTEYALADMGDFILIGESSELDPIAAGADGVMAVIRYADTFDRVADDYAIITGV